MEHGALPIVEFWRELLKVLPEVLLAVRVAADAAWLCGLGVCLCGAGTILRGLRGTR